MEQAILKGRKLHMSQIFMANGRVIPVTVVELESADELKPADSFLNMPVVIKGRSKGKGFTGAIKRWHFAKQGETRGASNKVRGPGAIGAQTPGRVFKGKKMAGHKGNINVTIKGLKIVNIDTEQKQIMVSGPIPGARNSEIFLTVDKPVAKETE
jgi:large subunit ribosomal protein L3